MDLRVVTQQYSAAADMGDSCCLRRHGNSFGWRAAYLGADATGGEVAWTDYYPVGWTAMGPIPHDNMYSETDNAENGGLRMKNTRPRRRRNEGFLPL